MSAKAAATRLNILQKAFELIYRNGYRTTSVDEIIATTQVTKGAFFYHFKSKDEMGLAMIKEVMVPGMRQVMLTPLENSDDPATELYNMMESLLIKDPNLVAKYGCPAINLIDEMSAHNDDFNKALSGLVKNWEEAIILCIEKGKVSGKTNKNANAKQVAYFIISGYGGIRNLGKVYGNEAYTRFLAELKNYLKTLV